MQTCRIALLAAATLAGAPYARGAETCRYHGTTDYNGKVGVVATVNNDGGALVVDVRVTLSATQFAWLKIHYLMEERSTWRGGTLTDLFENTRYYVNDHIVRQMWDRFQPTPSGLQGYRVQGKHEDEFKAKFPGFARFWDPATFGQDWWSAFAAAPPQRRSDLDLAAQAFPANMRTPFATAFYWVRYLSPAQTTFGEFLLGFKTYKTMEISLSPSPVDSGATAWHVPLHYIALSETPVSNATAIVSRDRHLQLLAFELHGSAGSAHGVIVPEGCAGGAVPTGLLK